jgi:hypothetical protein
MATKPARSRPFTRRCCKKVTSTPACELARTENSSPNGASFAASSNRPFAQPTKPKPTGLTSLGQARDRPGRSRHRRRPRRRARPRPTRSSFRASADTRSEQPPPAAKGGVEGARRHSPGLGVMGEVEIAGIGPVAPGDSDQRIERRDLVGHCRERPQKLRAGLSEKMQAKVGWKCYYPSCLR